MMTVLKFKKNNLTGGKNKSAGTTLDHQLWLVFLIRNGFYLLLFSFPRSRGS